MTASASSDKGKDTGDDYISIVPLPKIVFFYPTMVAAVICALMMQYVGKSFALDDPPKLATAAGWLFMVVFTVNVMIITFDFQGYKFLMVMFAGAALVLGLALISVYYPKFLPWLNDIVASIQPVALPQFYYLVFFVLLCSILSAVMFAYTTDIWYLHSNELVHKRGILGDLVKYPTLNLRVIKEINDVFEFMLLGSGSLVMQPTNTDRPIILENVMFITYKEKRIRELLSTLRVATA